MQNWEHFSPRVNQDGQREEGNSKEFVDDEVVQGPCDEGEGNYLQYFSVTR